MRGWSKCPATGHSLVVWRRIPRVGRAVAVAIANKLAFQRVFAAAAAAAAAAEAALSTATAERCRQLSPPPARRPERPRENACSAVEGRELKRYCHRPGRPPLAGLPGFRQ